MKDEEQNLDAERVKPKRKLSLPLRLFFFALCLLFFVIVVGVLFGLNALDRWVDRPFGRSGEVRLVIESGTPARAIARQLEESGLLDDARLLLLWLGREGRTGAIQAGEYRIQTPISPRDLARRLGHGAFERTLVVPEGWTTRQIARRLVAENWIQTENQWLDLAADVEGYCYPDTYRFDRGDGPERILERMREQFERQWKLAQPERRDPRSAELSQDEVVTLASMVQREARMDEEMPRIASVYLNRLARGMKLQCCATVRYALGEVWDRPLRLDDLEIDSPYNTYRSQGLPPGPIANPCRVAIEGVLRPTDTKDFYYVYSGEGCHTFSRTYADHRRAVREARRKHPDVFVPRQNDSAP